MTINTETLQIHRIPQSTYIDAVRWLPPLSVFERFIVLAVSDSNSDASHLEIRALNRSNPSILTPLSSHILPSRTTSLKVSHTLHKPLIAVSSFSGSVRFLFVEPNEVGFDGSELFVPEKVLHVGPISCIDIGGNGSECVCVGEDGRVSLVSVGENELSYRKVFDSCGLVSYSAVKWASPSEFVTGGLGYSVQWWDLRKPGAAVSQFKGNWEQGNNSGIVHSIDIHPSRKHTCLAGGSSGTVFTWDIRWPQQPIVLSGVGQADASARSLSASEVWEVQYDTFTRSSNHRVSSTRVLPVMICSEDGILAVAEQGEEPIELLVEPCAINCFDIDRQNPSDVICSLEWESIAILSRA
ncbi:nuclear pore complex protein NUP43 [Apium graveolens]|uniref:nuclear pore complex protein NUP43 n=1 Tax=Apium graveolens TaxID=4045 RepID=UPI003D7BD0D8